MDDSSDHITERGLAESSARLFPARSVMLTSRATIGAIAINTYEASTNQGFITCIPNDRVPLCFLFQWLSENVPTFQRMASGSTFKEISRGVFKTIEFLQPSPALVRRFEVIALPMADEALALQRQIQNLRGTRDLLLPRLLSGQIPCGKLGDDSMRDTLPRVFELKDTLSDPLHPDAYFQNFEPSLRTNQQKRAAFQSLERQLAHLDDRGWLDLKERAGAQLQKKDAVRGWQTLFDTLGEATGFVYLQRLGCTGVKFVPPSKRRGVKTPDLEAHQDGRPVLCEVKTINISQDEAESRKRAYEGTIVAGTVKTRVDDRFLGKLRSTMENAVNQLEAQDPKRKARRIVFTVLHFDDSVGDHQAEYFTQIDQALLVSPVSGAELVFSPANNFFKHTLTMRAATVFEFE